MHTHKNNRPMKGAARFLFGAALGVALGYAYVLLTQRGAPLKRAVALASSRPEAPQSERPEPAEEIAAS